MDEKLQLRQARRRLTGVGATLLIYYMIMLQLVIMAMIVDVAIYVIKHFQLNPHLNFEDLIDVGLLYLSVSGAALSNAWGYILAILVGCGILLIWKKPRYFKDPLFRRNKPMTFAAFMQALCVFMGAQMVFSLMQMPVEWMLNLFGLSATAALEMATVSTDTFSMFLYAGFLGPIAEELLFRGLLLRSVEAYGKRFAILSTAILFGMFHGNILQSPFAMLVGLVLAYVTVEYSIVWAIVLHIFNNFVVADLFSRLLKILPAAIAPLVELGVLGGFTVAAVIILVVKRKEVGAFFKENDHSWVGNRAMLTSPTVLIFLAFMTFSALLTITPMK